MSHRVIISAKPPAKRRAENLIVGGMGVTEEGEIIFNTDNGPIYLSTGFKAGAGVLVTPIVAGTKITIEIG